MTKATNTQAVTSSATQRIFVYGSLRRNLHNHHLLAGAPFVCEVESEAGYQLVDLGPFPGAVKSPCTERIKGEIYEVSQQQLDEMDMLEEHPTTYRRDRIETAAGPAWMYHFVEKVPAQAKLVASGDWRDYLASKPVGNVFNKMFEACATVTQQIEMFFATPAMAC